MSKATKSGGSVSSKAQLDEYLVRAPPTAARSAHTDGTQTLPCAHAINAIASGGPRQDKDGITKIGVTTYPYKVHERLYKEEFVDSTAHRLTHPHLSTFSPSGSLPFNVLSNSAADAGTVGWVTESQRSYTPKSATEAKNGPTSGVRTEQTTA